MFRRSRSGKRSSPVFLVAITEQHAVMFAPLVAIGEHLVRWRGKNNNIHPLISTDQTMMKRPHNGSST
eukprot:3362207-Pyramimonas_sp.AAC.2